MGTFRRWGLGWIPFWFYSAFVFHSSMLPPSKIPSFFLNLNDKLVHGVEYFLLAIFAANAFSKSKQFEVAFHAAGLAFAYCLLMGVSTEFAQAWVPGRTPEFSDLLSDAIGASLGGALVNRVPQPETAKGIY